MTALQKLMQQICGLIINEKREQVWLQIGCTLGVFLLITVSGGRQQLIVHARQNPLQVLYSVSPEIPSAAGVARAKGDVELIITIASDGNVLSVFIPKGHALLRECTKQAVKQWRFTASPGNQNSSLLQMTFRYDIKDRHTYSLQVLPFEQNYTLAVQPMPQPEVVSYILADEEAGITKCKVHNTLLRKDRVDIIYGLMGFQKGYWQARKKLFPNANSYIGGGCVVETDSPRYAEVLYCVHCRKAAGKWARQHRHLQFE